MSRPQYCETPDGCDWPDCPCLDIRTHYNPPPIPFRNFDWSAVDDRTHDMDTPVGWGATEQEAIDDLHEQLEEAS